MSSKRDFYRWPRRSHTARQIAQAWSRAFAVHVRLRTVAGRPHLDRAELFAELWDSLFVESGCRTLALTRLPAELHWFFSGGPTAFADFVAWRDRWNDRPPASIARGHLWCRTIEYRLYRRESEVMRAVTAAERELRRALSYEPVELRIDADGTITIDGCAVEPEPNV